MKAHPQNRHASRSLAVALLAVALLMAATIAAAFTREAEMEAARANSGLHSRVLVAGAAGEVGRLIARRASEQGYLVRAASGDLRNARTAHQATHGIDFVICGLAHDAWDGPRTAELLGYRDFFNLVNAARAARVRHFVLISSVWSEGAANDRELIQWKIRAEEYLKASGLSYSIVSPGELSDTRAGASGLRVVSRADRRHPASVSRADLARVAIDALRNPRARNKSFAVFNDATAAPEAWRKELYTLRRDAPVAAEVAGMSPNVGTTRGNSRIVVPQPPRERLMIDEEAADEAPPVEWSATRASSP
jgi:uncharacterized protein YbjT (DUF2867 family)